MKNATLIGLLTLFATAAYADVTRHPLPGGSTFPIAQAVEVSAGTTLVYHSGTLPGPANPDAEQGSREYWGDTEAQARGDPAEATSAAVISLSSNAGVTTHTRRRRWPRFQPWAPALRRAAAPTVPGMPARNSKPP